MKKSQIILSLLIIGVILVSIFQLPELTANPSPVTVKVGGNPSTVYPDMRKTFYAVTRMWIFYSNITYMVFKSSTDGSSWSSETPIRECTNGAYFSFWFDDTYFHYVFSNASYPSPLYYRRGDPDTDGTISWDSEVNILNTVTGHTYDAPFIVTNSSGYPWVGYTDHAGTILPKVVASSTKDGTWTNASGFPYQLSTESYYWKVIPTALTDGKMYVFYAADAFQAWGKLYTGSWGSEEAVAAGTDYENGYLSAISVSDDIHMVWLTYEGLNITYIKRTYGAGWGSKTLLEASITNQANPAMSIDPTSNDLYVIWGGSPTAHHLYYKVYNASTTTWEDTVDWLTESNFEGNENTINCWPIGSGGKIGVAWKIGTNTLRFDYITYTETSTTTTTSTTTSSTTTSISGSVYDYYNMGDDGQQIAYKSVSTSGWGYKLAQTFTTGLSPYKLTGVRVKLFRAGTLTGNMEIGIGTGATVWNGYWYVPHDLPYWISTVPTVLCNDITTNEAGEWYWFPISGDVTLNAKTEYTIFVMANSEDGNYANYIAWRTDWSHLYGGGMTYIGTLYDGVTSWGTASSDMMFEVWGNPLASSYATTTIASTVSLVSSITTVISGATTIYQTTIQTTTKPSTTVITWTTVTTTGGLVGNPNMFGNAIIIGILLVAVPLGAAMFLGLLGFTLLNIVMSVIGMALNLFPWWIGIINVFLLLVVVLLFREQTPVGSEGGGNI